MLDPDSRGANWPSLLFDGFSEPVRHAALLRMLRTGAPATTEMLTLALDVALPVARPSGAVYAPLFWVSAADGSRTMTGATSLIFSWDAGILQSTPGTVRGLHVVIYTAARVFTVFVSEGKVTNLGYGDFHDRTFDRYARNLTVRTADDFAFTFQVTPSAAYRDRFEVLDPVAATASVVAIICGVTVLSVANDVLTRRRMGRLRAQAAEEKTRRELIGRLTAAGTESDVLRAAVSALQRIYPGAVAGALGVFGEGNGTEALGSCHVFANSEPASKALLASLPASVGGEAAASSVRFVCRDGAIAAAADSRDFPRGLAEFDDWRAAAQAGLRSSVAISAAVAAGPQVVGFVQLHLTRGILTEHTPRAGGPAMAELCSAVGEAVFVRRAFALARGADADAALGGRFPRGRSLGAPGGAFAHESARRRFSPSAVSTDSERSGASGSVRPSDRGGGGDSQAERHGPGELTPADLDALNALDAEAADATAALLDWDLDCWELSDARCKRLISHMFHSLGLLRRFSISPQTIGAFLDDVSVHYYAVRANFTDFI